MLCLLATGEIHWDRLTHYQHSHSSYFCSPYRELWLGSGPNGLEGCLLWLGCARPELSFCSPPSSKLKMVYILMRRWFLLSHLLKGGRTECKSPNHRAEALRTERRSKWPSSFSFIAPSKENIYHARGITDSQFLAGIWGADSRIQMGNFSKKRGFLPKLNPVFLWTHGPRHHMWYFQSRIRELGSQIPW